MTQISLDQSYTPIDRIVNLAGNEQSRGMQAKMIAHNLHPRLIFVHKFVKFEIVLNSDHKLH